MSIFGCFLLPGCKTASSTKRDAAGQAIHKSFIKNPSMARWAKVEAAIKARDLDTAIWNASQILVDHPGDPLGYLFRARAYCLQQDHGLALADFNTAIRLDPGSAEAYARRGFVYSRKKKDSVRALENLGKAIALGMEILNWDYEPAKGIMPVNLYHERAINYQLFWFCELKETGQP